jgi:hypothetical protein
MGDVNRVPLQRPRPEPDPVVAQTETQLHQLRAQLDDLSATVARLQPAQRRTAVEAVIAAIDHNLGEASRRLHATGTEQ